MLAAALALGAAPARAGEPPPVMTQLQAQYRPSPNGLFSCANCTFFRPPQSCQVVTGAISPHGWCKFFDMAD